MENVSFTLLGSRGLVREQLPLAELMGGLYLFFLVSFFVFVNKQNCNFNYLVFNSIRDQRQI